VHDIPTIIRRKQAHSSHRENKYNELATGFLLESEGEGDYFGITLDGDSLYCLWDFTVTHNTHLLIHMARLAWMSGKKVLLVSMEMTLRQVAYRFYAQRAGVNPALLRRGRLSTRHWNRVREVMEEMEDDNRFMMYAGNFKGKKPEEIDILIQELSPDVVYIDGMYIMEPSNAPSRTDRISKVGYIADELKKMAIQRNRPIIATSQFSRDAGKGGKGGGLEQIGFSDAIGQHASLVIAVKMPPNERSPRPDKRVIETLKGREGEYTKFAIDFKFSPLSFEQCPRETQELMFGTRDRPIEDTDGEDGEPNTGFTMPHE
jgi:replicative DNA helicase